MESGSSGGVFLPPKKEGRWQPGVLVLWGTGFSPLFPTGTPFFKLISFNTLPAPANLKRETLESAISKAVQGRLTVAGPSVDLKWLSHGDGSRAWRELDMPLLGWKLCYAQRDRELILANSPELLAAVFATG